MKENAIAALKKDKCQFCAHEGYMYGGQTNSTPYIGCAFCSTLVEITSVQWDDNVRLCDTYSKKFGG